MFPTKEVFNFRRDFDIERVRETEEYEKALSLRGPNYKNNSNAESKYVADTTILPFNFLAYIL